MAYVRIKSKVTVSKETFGQKYYVNFPNTMYKKYTKNIEEKTFADLYNFSLSVFPLFYYYWIISITKRRGGYRIRGKNPGVSNILHIFTLSRNDLCQAFHLMVSLFHSDSLLPFMHSLFPGNITIISEVCDQYHDETSHVCYSLHTHMHGQQ